MNLHQKIIKLLKTQKKLPIINTSTIEDDFFLINSILKKNKNINCIEITLRKDNSLNIAVEIKKKYPTLTIGVGSILDIKQFNDAKKYNFDFYISPGIIYDLVNNHEANYIPGAETISEIMLLNQNKYNIIKFFPAEINNGLNKLKSIENIFKDTLFIPTGGINNKNQDDYLNLNNVLCVGKSENNN